MRSRSIVRMDALLTAVGAALLVCGLSLLPHRDASADTKLVGDAFGECYQTNNTCSTLNSGQLYGTFCSSGAGTACTACTDWIFREWDCDWWPVPCDPGPPPAPCGEKFLGSCQMDPFGDGVRRCKPAGAPVGTCDTERDHCQ